MLQQDLMTCTILILVSTFENYSEISEANQVRNIRIYKTKNTWRVTTQVR